MTERLQKVLANQGFGSRREIEGWIEEGKIKVNGEVAKLGCQVDGTETIHINDRLVTLKPLDSLERRVLLYYKPEGEISTRHDPEGRRTIFESLPKINNGRWISVGRLDINTQGLLLVTNDGELAHRLMHPSHEIEREYAVRVIGEFTDEMAENMKNGVEFEDGLSKFEEILWSGGTGANFWYHVTVKGGKNREVRRLWESQGLMVSRLIRIRYGNVELPRHLKAGQFVDIDDDVLKELVESVELEHVPTKKRSEKDERVRSKPRRVGRQQQERRRGDRPERGERGERNDRFDRSDRPRGDRQARPNRSDRNDRNERSDRNDRNERPNRSDRPSRDDRSNRSQRDDRDNRSQNRSERPSRDRNSGNSGKPRRRS
ncbi:pseudouridine synthase [Ignatzschineria sp. RMDPL8A]|uniref:23S rRNA pseudouridine(2605) synthase RluB n=1 Tax=Ignatzschineria sp. RMDPL8A TaxID=2999236 RepID=UPI002446669A|nr:pseudouridine synthase [Ignatzschineria sp. RMDPL8A]MDG9729850.1 pseudouridine synthase [Ignatzschineria sp. RMDPL8A]